MESPVIGISLDVEEIEFDFRASDPAFVLPDAVASLHDYPLFSSISLHGDCVLGMTSPSRREQHSLGKGSLMLNDAGDRDPKSEKGRFGSIKRREGDGPISWVHLPRSEYLHALALFLSVRQEFNENWTISIGVSSIERTEAFDADIVAFSVNGGTRRANKTLQNQPLTHSDRER